MKHPIPVPVPVPIRIKVTGVTHQYQCIRVTHQYQCISVNASGVTHQYQCISVNASGVTHLCQCFIDKTTLSTYSPVAASIETSPFLLHLFLIELSSHLSLSTLLIDVQSAKRPIQENLRPKDSQVTIGATSATGDVTVLIDRMGNLVLAVQALFNQRCSKNGLVSIEAATGE